jgi:ABC-type uncharacterized transport system permease subunit
MCVGVYLIWGCRASFRLLGLAVMPLAASLLALAWAAGGTGAAREGDFGSAFLALHVGLVTAAFAGFTVAAALAAVYLWQDRGLKHHVPGLLRVRSPSLQTLDTLVGRTTVAGLAALTLGVGVGLARLEADGGRFDAVIGATLLTWLIYAAAIVLRYEAGWRGRRGARLALGGLGLVILVRLGSMPIDHF